MAKIDLQYDLVNYTPASASPVEANFNRVEQHINQEVIERGGTVAMTAQLKLVGNPVADLDAAPKQYVDQSITPVGSLVMYAGATVPPGGRWALCNGAELETATYPTLFAAIGYAYGGTGGRFNLPNLIDRVGVGVGTRALGASGGTADGQVITHSHDYSHGHAASNTGTVSSDHAHAIGFNTSDVSNLHGHTSDHTCFIHDPFGPGFGITVNQGQTIPANYTQITVQGAGYHVHGVSGGTGPINANHVHTVNVPVHSARTETVGVAAANANMQPYVVVNYLIRVQ